MKAASQQDGPQPSPDVVALRDSVTELANAMKGLCHPLAGVATPARSMSLDGSSRVPGTMKRAAPTRASSILNELNNMSEGDRRAVLTAAGMRPEVVHADSLLSDGFAAPGLFGSPIAPSPMRKAATLSDGGLGHLPPPMPRFAPGLAAAGLGAGSSQSTGTSAADLPAGVGDDDDLSGRTPTRNLIAVYREKAAGLTKPKHADLVPFDEADPLAPPKLAQLAGPNQWSRPGVEPANLEHEIDTQPTEILTTAAKLVPELLVVLAECCRPCSRLTMLLRTYGVEFKADSRQHLAMALLSILIARRLAGMPCVAT
jgi:hypothetical protein